MNVAANAREILESNAYMTLATASELGVPWASPVWFAHDHGGEFLWVSRPDSRHSRNIAVRPEVAIVVFDSTVAVDSAQAVYVEGTALAVDDPDVERKIATYSTQSQARGGPPWTAHDVTGDAPHRLYIARANTHYVLSDGDRRLEVTLDRPQTDRP